MPQNCPFHFPKAKGGSLTAVQNIKEVVWLNEALTKSPHWSRFISQNRDPLKAFCNLPGILADLMIFQFWGCYGQYSVEGAKSYPYVENAEVSLNGMICHKKESLAIMSNEFSIMSNLIPISSDPKPTLLQSYLFCLVSTSLILLATMLI